MCGFLGALAGAQVLLLVKPEPLKPIVLVLLLCAAAFVAWPRKPSHGRPHAWAMIALFPITFAIGFYDGFFGPGTGSMLIVVFVLLFGDTMTRASGNAKVVNLASNLAAPRPLRRARRGPVEDRASDGAGQRGRRLHRRAPGGEEGRPLSCAWWSWWWWQRWS